MAECAVSSTLSAQVLSITMGLGLPWTLYLLTGHSITLASDASTKITNAVLIAVLVALVVIFFATIVCGPRGAHGGHSGVGGPQLGKNGSSVILATFAVAFVGFVVVEVLNETGCLDI